MVIADGGYYSQCARVGKASVFRGRNLLQVQTLGPAPAPAQLWPVCSGVGSQPPAQQASMSTSALGFGVAAPSAASPPHTPRQLASQQTCPAAAGVGTGTCGEGRLCRTMGKPHPLPAPQEAAAPHGSPLRLLGTACQDLRAGDLRACPAASGTDNTNVTLVAGAGSEAGGATEEKTAQ